MTNADPCHGKTPWPSLMVAENMVTVHTIAAPGCSSFNAYRCGDHYHVGHRTLTDGRACKAAHPFRRPPQPGRR